MNASQEPNASSLSENPKWWGGFALLRAPLPNEFGTPLPPSGTSFILSDKLLARFGNRRSPILHREQLALLTRLYYQIQGN
jgi:hypothetical protein